MLDSAFATDAAAAAAAVERGAAATGAAGRGTKQEQNKLDRCWGEEQTEREKSYGNGFWVCVCANANLEQRKQFAVEGMHEEGQQWEASLAQDCQQRSDPQVLPTLQMASYSPSEVPHSEHLQASLLD